MQKCIAYVRVSTVKQGEKGVSLQEQRRAIAEYATRHDLSITDWFEEKETAAKRGRPTFAKVLALLRRGKVSAVIIHKIDRSARNLRDWSDLGELIDAGVSVYTACENLDLHSRGGRLSADIQAVVAADFIRNLREETKKGIYGRLRQGLLPLPAPLGYIDCGPGKPKTIDPICGPLVRQAFELYASGNYSLRSLLEELSARGLRSRANRKIALNSLSLILNNSFYTGLISIKRSGETFAGIHEPLISTRTFSAVQARLKGKAPVKIRRHGFVFRRLIRCASCGNCLIGETQKGHIYYRCHTRNCPLRCIREDLLHERMHQRLAPLHFSEEEQAELERILHSLQRDAGETRRATLRTVDLQLSQTQERLMRLTDAFIDGNLEKAVFEERKRRLLFEQRELEEKRKALTQNSGDDSRSLRELLELANSALLSYLVAPPEEKRELVEETTSNRELLPNGPLVELALPFKLIAERTSVQCGCPTRGTNRSEGNMPEKSTQFGYLETLIDTLLAWIQKHPR